MLAFTDSIKWRVHACMHVCACACVCACAFVLPVQSTDNLYSDSDTGHTLGESPAESLNSLILKTPSISDIELMSIEDKRCEQFAHLQDKKYTQSCSHDDVIVEVGSPSHQRHGRNTHTTIISPNRDYRWLKKPLQKFGHKLKRGFIPDTPQFLSGTGSIL